MSKNVLRVVAAIVGVLIGLFYVNVLFGIPGLENFRTAASPYVGGFLVLVLLYALYVAFSGDVAIWDAAVGEDGRASTSKFQVFLWTIVVIFGYVALVTARIQADITGPLPNLPTNVLLALGISIGTATAAAAVTAGNINSGREVRTQDSNRGLAPIVQTDDGRPDLAKIQLLGWTLIAIGVYLTSLAHAITTVSATSDLPDIDSTLVVLMGIGSATYLGNKLVPSSSPAIVGLSAAQAKLGDTFVVKGVHLGSSGFVQIDGRTLQSGVAWGDTEVSVTVPQTPPTGDPWRLGTPLTVHLLTPGGGAVNDAVVTLQPAG